MVFAIRDDDVNYYTDPGEIEAAYASIWEVCPPTLSMITHVKGNWRFWVNELYQKRHAIDWEAWDRDNQIFPIDQNASLVNFLKENYKTRKLDLALHAIHHRNDDAKLPAERDNNYIRGAEFYTTQDLTRKVEGALEYVQHNLNIDLKVFTPPQNLMSKKGYRAVVNNRLSIVGAGLAFWKKELTMRGLSAMLNTLSFKVQHPRVDFPHPLHFKNHAEIIHHYPLHPTTRTHDLIDRFESVRRYDGVFVLSTHYHEFNTPLTYDASRRMQDVFKDFMQHVIKTPGIKFSDLTSLLTNRNS